MECPIWLMFTLGLLSAAPARADDLLRPHVAAKGQIDQVAAADEENEASEHEYWCGGPRSFRSCVSTILWTDRVSVLARLETKRSTKPSAESPFEASTR